MILASALASRFYVRGALVVNTAFRMLAVCLVHADYMYFLVVRSALDVFDCDKNSVGHVFLVMAPSVPCWEPEHFGVVPFGFASLVGCEYLCLLPCRVGGREVFGVRRWTWGPRLLLLHSYEVQR